MLAELSPWNLSAIAHPMYSDETSGCKRPIISFIDAVLDSPTDVLTEILVF